MGRSLYLSNSFWDCWLKEYLPTLLPRKKGFEKDSNIEIGDLVLIIDNNVPRNIHGERESLHERSQHQITK